jgi:hypothetical protein
VLCCIRFVSHYQISDSHVQYALTYVEVCKSLDYFQLSLLVFHFCDNTETQRQY